MASAYTNDLRLEEIGTGEQSGTWGDTTNTNLELISEAFSFGTEAITTNANTHTSTIADGGTDEARSIYLKYTGALDSDCTITIGPNTVSKLWFIENATTDSGSSGPYNIIIKQGSGATVTVPNGHVKAIFSDGAGSGGAMVEAFKDLNVTDNLIVSGSTPTLTIGDAGAEDTKLVFDGNAKDFYVGLDDSADKLVLGVGSSVGTNGILTLDDDSVTIGDGAAVDSKIVFDGNAQDFYVGLDDSADDLVIGHGSTVGTNPAIEIDENQDIKFAQSIGVGQAASSTTGDIRAQTMSLLGTTPTLTLGDGGEEDVKIQFNGVKDFYIANDDSADKLVIGEGSTVGTNSILTITDDTVTLGDGAAVDTALIFDGNAQDFYVALDDSADDLLIGNGSTVGSNIAIGINASQVVKFNDAYTFPTSDGSANQVLQTNGSGALSFGTVSSSPTAIQDADGDTKVQCEESSDEDVIRFDTAGSERLNIDGSGNITHAGGRTKLGGTLADTGVLAVLTGSSGGVNAAADTQSNGSVIFGNTDGSSVSPAIMMKGDGSQCAIRSATANGANHDIEFNIREEDGTDFASTGGSGFMFSRHGTDLLQITRHGNVDIGFSSGVGTGDGNPALRVTQSSTSFSGNLLQLQAKRSSSSAFSLIQAYANFASDAKFKVRGDGEVSADGSFSGGGADYAEFFEWNDGNSSNEDRVGYSVSLVNGKIKIAESGETIIGVISGNPSVVGDAQELYWQGKYEKDEYGRDVYEDYTQTEWVESKDNGTDTPEQIKHSYQTDKIPSGISAPSDATVVSKDEDGNNLRRRKRSSSYDESLTYIPRSERKEWACVGLMGKVRIKKGQQTEASWIKLKDVSSDVEEWLIK